MNFIILDSDPVESARLCPDSVLIESCARGCEILSNIGHIVGLKWSFQVKPEGIKNDDVTTHSVDRTTFWEFLDYLVAYLKEFRSRKGQSYGRANCYVYALTFSISCRLPAGRSFSEATAERVLRDYNKQLTDHEKKRLKEIS